MKAICAMAWVTVLTWCFSECATAQEWSRFRGPNGTGLGIGANFPGRWGEGEFLWRTKIPGAGHSSPVLWGDTLFVTSADREADKFTILCLRAGDGKLAWRKDFPAPHYRLHANNNYASGTPVTDESRAYVLRVDAGELVLTALTHQGELAWEFKTGTFKTEHGLGHSPIIYGSRVVFSDDQDLAGRVMAVDAESGRLVWESPRSRGRADYSTPCVVETAGNLPWLIFNSQEDGMCALNADNGAVAWTARGVLDKRSVSSPIVAGGLVTGSCGSGGGGNYVVALRPPERPGQKPEVAYEVRRSAPYVCTPIAVGDSLFLWSDGGIVTCMQADTGAIHWQQRVGGNYFSSPVSVDGKIYGTSTAGEVVVLSAANEFKELGRSPLGEATHATPAIANGRIYFRTLGHILAIGPRR